MGGKRNIRRGINRPSKMRGEALNGDIGLSLKDRKIGFLLLFYGRTVLFRYESHYIKSLA